MIEKFYYEYEGLNFAAPFSQNDKSGSSKLQVLVMQPAQNNALVICV